MTEARRILAVVFDAVGTLLVPREPVGETYARLAGPHGVQLPGSRIEEAFQRVFAAAPPNAHPDAAPSLRAECERSWWRARVRETFRAADGSARFDDFDAFFAQLWTHYADAGAWRLASGALPCLDALATRGLRLGLLSNFDLRLRRLLGELGLAERFAVVTLPGEVGAAKPAPAIFDACLAHLAVPSRAALYVGDHAAQDVAAARAAGWLALDVGTLPDLAALPAAIDTLERELAAA